MSTKPRLISARPVSDDKSLLPFTNNELLPFLRQQQLAYSPLIGGQIAGGPGAPTTPPPNGATVALWLRSDGGIGTSLYLYRAGAWAAIA